VRLRNAHLGPADLADILSGLAARGIRAGRNYMVAQAPIGKSLGGPEPDSGAGPFGQYQVPPASGGPAVAVIDTGITAEQRTDGWLARIARNGNVDPLDVLPQPGRLDPMAGHGTFVSGIIEQVAPGAAIDMYRALDTDGLATEADLADAMVTAVGAGAGILSLSFGCQTVDDEEPVAFRAALDLIGTSALLVAAAGNFGDERRVWPAAFPSVVAVAALDAQLQPTGWSSRGSWVEFSTVGEGLLSTYVTGTEDTNSAPEVFPADAWGRWTGTSFAAPQIAAYVARRCQELGLDPPAARDAILNEGTEVPGFGRAVRILPGM
jgi:thermitase